MSNTATDSDIFLSFRTVQERQQYIDQKVAEFVEAHDAQKRQAGNCGNFNPLTKEQSYEYKKLDWDRT
jgi:hypothetical protein